MNSREYRNRERHAVGPGWSIRVLELLARDGALDFIEKNMVTIRPLAIFESGQTDSAAAAAAVGVPLNAKRDPDDALIINATERR